MFNHLKSSILQFVVPTRNAFIKSGFIFWALDSTAVFASESEKRNVECQSSFAERFRVIESGRDAEQMPTIVEALRLLNSPGGVLESLGIHVPDLHILTMVQGINIAHAVANNGHAVGHWLDGRNIIKSLGEASGILEIVPPHSKVARSVYQDTLPIEYLIPIIVHVAGHVHFSKHTRFSQKRAYDVFEESYKLHELLEKLKWHHDAEEVDSWYFLLSGLAGSQDFVRGTYQEDPPRNSTTASILQLFIRNLPVNELPAWKIEVAQQFLKVHSYKSGSWVTKTINEGIATIVEEVVFPYLPYRDHNYFFKLAELNAAGAAPSLSNPYWLGREAFRRLRERVNAQNDGLNLSQLQKDRLFIEAATKAIAQYDSYDFLLANLDDEWVQRHRLAIVRPIGYDDGEVGKPATPPKDPNHSAIWVVESTESKSVVKEILDKHVDVARFVPRIESRSLNFNKTGVVRLTVSGPEEIRSVPLKLESALKTLWMHAAVLGKPVEIETTQKFTEVFWNNPFRYGPWHPQRRSTEITTLKVLLRVAPDGSLTYEILSSEWDPTEEQEMTRKFQAAEDRLKEFIDFAGLYDGKESFVSRFSKLGVALTELNIGGSSPAVSSIEHFPTWPAAVAAYYTEIGIRLEKAVAQMLQPGKHVIRRGSGVGVQVLPEIPRFEFDSKWTRRVRSVRTSFELDAKKGSMPDFVENSKKGLETIVPFAGILPGTYFGIGQVDEGRGELIWGPEVEVLEPGEGEGEDSDGADFGDGDGDGPADSDGDGDSGDGDPNVGQGDGALDPSWVELPLDFYGEVLGQTITLPRLKPKSEANDHIAKVFEGARSGRNGRLHQTASAEQIIKLGLDQSMLDGELDVVDMFQRGLTRMHPANWRVYDRNTEPQPQYNAVVLVMVDFSGSMGGDPLLKAKKLVYDMRALLLKKYSQLEFIFVAFDTEPRVYKSADKFFRLQLGGGTSYAEGFRKSAEELDKYPTSLWDRYAIAIGDLEDYDTERIMDQARSVFERTEYMGVVQTSIGGERNELSRSFRTMAKQEDYFGFAFLGRDNPYSTDIFQKLFKNED